MHMKEQKTKKRWLQYKMQISEHFMFFLTGWLNENQLFPVLAQLEFELNTVIFES